jgi:hypothetical protein
MLVVKSYAPSDNHVACGPKTGIAVVEHVIDGIGQHGDLSKSREASKHL